MGVKFRAWCVTCGTRQPRAATSWTVDQWMRRHERDQHTTPRPTPGDLSDEES